MEESDNFLPSQTSSLKLLICLRSGNFWHLIFVEVKEKEKFSSRGLSEHFVATFGLILL